MGLNVGPKILNDYSLVYGFETNQKSRLSIGKPGTNITTGINLRWSGSNNSYFSNGKLFETSGYTENVYIPTLGKRTVKCMNIYNVYSGYGTDGNYNCCPSLFHYGEGITVTGGTTYTYQIVYKCDSGYTHPNFMYHYEYGPSGYITEFGVHDDSKRTHLGGGWYHAWNTFTANASATYFNTGMWYYQYNVKDKVSVAAISISPGSEIRPPQQIISSSTTRSNTQSLTDFKKSKTIDVSGVSFSSTGKITLDGTNDSITLSTNTIPAGAYFTAEFFISDYGNSWGRNTMFLYGWNTNQQINIHLPWSNGNIYWDCGNDNTNSLGDRIDKSITQAELTATKHWVFTKNAITGVMNIYRNGSLWHTGSGNTRLIGGLTGVYLFNNSAGGSYSWGGTCEQVRFYNKELTSEEVLNNYNALKNRT
jgi:hypothetical protein